MNPVEVLLVLIVVIGAWAGWRQGVLASAAGLFALVASVGVAFWAYRWPAAWLRGPVGEVWAAPAAFVGTLVVTGLVLGATVRRLLAGVPARVQGHAASRLLGALPGAARGLVHAAIVSALMLSMPLLPVLDDAARDSPWAERLSRPTLWLEARLAPIFEPVARIALDRLTVRTQSTGSVTLPFRVADTRPRPDLEARMLDLVNVERAEAGLRPVKADPELTEVARAHSVDMFARGYFSHVTPDGKDPFDRMRAARLRFLNAGENLALARSLQLAHDGLMNSPGHKANILRPGFGRLGIGVQDGGFRGLMITQNFRN